ncbi:MAG TPA: GspH/FimT family pseudopilin [Rubrivivax sp.]|nr:GspH/FimT family pseudopilin [Rubrivivax sp.]
MLTRPRRRTCGFTIVELMVAITLLAILLAMAMPSFTTWVRNAQVRTVSDALQNGLRLAQAEAVRRHRQVVFFRTNQAACNTTITADASGAFWSVRALPLLAGDAAEAVQCGVLSDVAEGVAIAGAAALCFNSAGRQVANATPGVGQACVLDASGTSTFDLTSTNSDRPLRVLVALGGSVRMCDPAKALSSSTPEGCP